MTHFNQADIVKQRRPLNVVLSVVFLGLLVWVVGLFYREIHRQSTVINQINTTKQISIQRKENTILLVKTDDESWLIEAPFTGRASEVVIETFLTQLNSGCHAIDDSTLTREIDFFVTVNTDKERFLIGELNTAADSVYVKHRGQLSLCDKLVASIALAPAINYLDKQLYLGELTAIQGSFGKITGFSGIDLSVLELAPAEAETATAASVSDLIFITEHGQFTYRVLPPPADGKHLLLFDTEKSLIYVIAAQPKLNAILGL